MKVQKPAVKRTRLSESYWKMWGIPLYSRGKSGVLKIIKGWQADKAKNKWIATVNPEFMMKTLEDEQFLKILKQADLNVIDGIGLIWAKKVLGRQNQGLGRKIIWAAKVGAEILKGGYRDELASGSDLIEDICRLTAKRSGRIFFLGGWGDRAERTAEYFKAKYPTLSIQFSPGEPEVNNESVLKQISEFEPEMLFVAYGMKKQEEWIEKNINKLNFGTAMGVGRSFDYYSGDLKRAPKRWRKLGMEWLYSLLQEPKRWKRQLVLPKFVWKVLTD